jgi:hypothetical protein
LGTSASVKPPEQPEGSRGRQGPRKWAVEEELEREKRRRAAKLALSLFSLAMARTASGWGVAGCRRP